MSETHDDVASALIGALANEGRHVDDGGFTLDRKAALAKLRGYQLANPLEYLLILVEAAWAAEPSDKTRRIKIECRTDTYIDLRGPSLEAAGLRDLFAAVFGSTRDLDGEPLRRARALQLIGLAVNNVLGLDGIEAVTIDGFDADEQHLRLRVDPKGELALVDARPEPPLQPGWIRVQVHANSAMERGFAQRELITRRCRYASFPVHVDGRMVSKQHLSGVSGRRKVTLDGNNIGEAGYVNAPGPAQVLVVNRGVEIELPDAGMPEGLIAVVHADLPMDLSRSQLIDGSELEAIRKALHQVRGRLGPPPRRYSQPEASTMTTGQLIWNLVVGVLIVIVAVRMLVELLG